MRRLPALAFVILMVGCQAQPSPPLPSPLPTAAPSSTAPSLSPSPTPIAPSSAVQFDEVITGEIRWTRATQPGTCGLSAAIVRRDGSLLAVCTDWSINRIEILTSPDGSHWHSTQPVGLVPRSSLDVVIVNAITETDGGDLVAVGAEALDDMSRGDAATWASTDGVTWRRSPSSAALADAEMLDVIMTNRGFIAVGDDGFPGGNVQLPGLRGAAIWTSADGVRWIRAPAPEAAAHNEMRGIVQTPSGWAAWGGGAFPSSGAVWTADASTRDGSRWAAAPGPGGGDWGPIARVVAIPGRLVGVGSWSYSDNTGNTVATFGMWGSYDDGQSWGILSAPSGAPIGSLWDLTSLNSVLIATGSDGLVVTSHDHGDTWQWIPADPSGWLATLSPVLAFHGELIGFATEASDTQTTFDIWVGHLP